MVRLTKWERARRTFYENLASLDTGIAYKLGDLVNQFGDDADLLVMVESNFYGDYDVFVNIRRIREETDDEYDARIANFKAKQSRKALLIREEKKAEEERERQLYEQLKAKFGE